MRLSEAMRLGAMLFRKAEGALRRRTPEGEMRCAIGTALGAVGKACTYGRAEELWPHLTDYTGYTCPVCCVRYRPWSMKQIIIHMNDTHRCSREEIADWVASVEPHS